MNIKYEASSRSDGIDFFVSSKNITLCVTRKESGEIETHIIKGLIKNKVPIVGKIMVLVCAIIYASFSSKFKFLAEPMSLFFCFSFFIGVYYFCSSFFIKKKNEGLCKYHAAEHRVLNYKDKYEKLPEKIDDLRNISNISIRCGSTVLTVCYFTINIIVIIIEFVPSVILKIICIIASLFVNLYFWANGHFDFIQKMLVEDPDDEMLELAIYGIIESNRLDNE